MRISTAVACGAGLKTVCLLLAAAVCSASGVDAGISQTVFLIQAANSEGAAAYAADYSDGSWDPVAQTYTWELAAPVSLDDGAAHIADFNGGSLSIVMTPAPVMSFEFDVVSGASDTQFEIESAVVDFNTIPSSQAAAAFVACCTVRDSGAGDGMWAYEPGLVGDGMLISNYNVNSSPGAVFSDLLSVVGSHSGGSVTGSEYQPGSGFAPLGADVSDACMRASFVLTGLDRGEFSASYTLVPEPASSAVLALGFVLVLARGKRR